MAIVTGKNQRWRVWGAHLGLCLLIAVTLFPLLAVVSISLRPGNFCTFRCNRCCQATIGTLERHNS